MNKKIPIDPLTNMPMKQFKPLTFTLPKPKAIIVDIDSTLANNDHRQHLLDEIYSEEENDLAAKDVWEKFHEGIIDDGLNIWCHKIIKAYIKDHHIILSTGRGEDNREASLKWLWKHNVEFGRLLMRDYADFGTDQILPKKKHLINIMQHYEVVLAIDDDREVCALYHSYDIPTLNVMTSKNH